MLVSPNIEGNSKHEIPRLRLLKLQDVHSKSNENPILLAILFAYTVNRRSSGIESQVLYIHGSAFSDIHARLKQRICQNKCGFCQFLRGCMGCCGRKGTELSDFSQHAGWNWHFTFDNWSTCVVLLIIKLSFVSWWYIKFHNIYFSLYIYIYIMKFIQNIYIYILHILNL